MYLFQPIHFLKFLVKSQPHRSYEKGSYKEKSLSSFCYTTYIIYCYWIAAYPVDNAIHPLNDWHQKRGAKIPLHQSLLVEFDTTTQTNRV